MRMGGAQLGLHAARSWARGWEVDRWHAAADRREQGVCGAGCVDDLNGRSRLRT